MRNEGRGSQGFALRPEEILLKLVRSRVADTEAGADKQQGAESMVGSIAKTFFVEWICVLHGSSILGTFSNEIRMICTAPASQPV